MASKSKPMFVVVTFDPTTCDGAFGGVSCVAASLTDAKAFVQREWDEFRANFDPEVRPEEKKVTYQKFSNRWVTSHHDDFWYEIYQTSMFAKPQPKTWDTRPQFWQCYDCGSTIKGHHTELCDMVPPRAKRDLPAKRLGRQQTQWWTGEVPKHLASKVVERVVDDHHTVTVLRR